MNAWQKTLGLGAILALLVTANAGCVAFSEDEDVTGEATEELSSTDDGASNDTTGSQAPSKSATAQLENNPDPLPWRELTPAAREPEMNSGPDPLPWAPGTVSTGATGTGAGTKHDGE